MVRQIEIKFKRGGKFVATLLDEVTPQTCDILWDHLPIEGLATQARYSGEEFFFKTDLKGIEPENQRMDFGIGDMVYNPEPSYRAVLFYYGHNLHLSQPFNPLARIDNTYIVGWGWPLDKIKEIGHRVWLKGQEKVIICREGE